MNIARSGQTGSLAPAQIASVASRLATRIDRPIVLVGMMGVGKSTVGRKLAAALGLPFADADDEIATAAQMSINEIFEHFGEDHFRDGERRVIARLLEGGRGVVATGGGAFVQEDTRQLILDKGIAVWLDCDVDTLVERLKRTNKRPLLRGGNVREIVTRMKTEREGAYAQAPVHVFSGSGAHTDTVAQILGAIDKWL